MNANILIVDDELHNLEVLNRCLSIAEFKVLIARSGPEALQRVTHTQPDMIILDIMMPEMDGFEVCRRLREREATQNTPIIFLSIATEITEKVKGLEMGAVDYITKPFDPDEVLARVKKHLIIRSLQQQLEEKNSQLQQLNQTLAQEITKRQQYEEALQIYAEQLEEKVEARTKTLREAQEQLLRQEKLATVSQISASMAHELRNPLGAINQSIYYLRRIHERGSMTSDNPKVAKHLDLIASELNRSRLVISDLLESTRSKTPRPEAVDLRPVVLEVVQRLHKADKYQIEVQFALEPDPFMLSVDQAQFHQVIFNLLSNTTQARLDQDLVLIKADLLPHEGQYCITIQDKGVGIASENLSKVFTPLYTTRSIGTGLGLTICQQIIKNHDGSIALSSKLGQGTTVKILLPTKDF